MSAPRLRVLVLDDHQMFRNLLERALGRVCEVVPGASTLPEAEAAFRRGGFDVVLADLSWAGDGPILPQLISWRRSRPECRILVLTAYDDPTICATLMAAGLDGFLVKHSDFSEVLEALQVVALGGRYVSTRVDVSEAHEESPLTATATERVFALLAEGWSRKQVAGFLHMSIKTVDYHIAAIRRHLGLGSRVRPRWRQLFARHSGTIPPLPPPTTV